VARAFLAAGRLLAADPPAAVIPIRRYAGADALSELDGVVAYLAERVA
jgi:hypothetical protein